MAGEVIGTFGCLQIRPANRFAELKISGTGAGEGGHMTATSKENPEVIAVGPDIEPLGAVNAKPDDRKGNFEDFISVHPDPAWRAVDGFSFSRKFVEGDPVFLDGGYHRGDLVELAGKLLKGGFDGGLVERGNRLGFEYFSLGILRIGGFSELQGSLVLLVFSHEEILNAGGSTDDEHEESGRDGVEGAAVADFPLMKTSADKVHDIVGGSSRGLVDQEKAVELRGHGRRICLG